MHSPSTRRGRTAAAPLRELGADPETGSPVVVRSGRFGPYVTDGTTNASLRKGDEPETITIERAAELLADRRAAGPPVKRAGRAAKAPKKAAKRATTQKATTAKKSAKKAGTKTTAQKMTAKKATATKTTATKTTATKTTASKVAALDTVSMAGAARDSGDADGAT